MSDKDMTDLINQFDNFDIKLGKITASQRGHPQLFYDGFFYRKTGLYFIRRKNKRDSKIYFFSGCEISNSRVRSKKLKHQMDLDY
ncbi:hypothetical protein BpHYR1_008346 [Brachionus plicatilis]|uniref:Uncharacterized protein n=1 Tax=Brachionus plicatilis TaxID=10195 RepID=A0A3M7SDA9_BRAPC|nr:hypothetical protein BpHYR1_008346 [Brachionus plicatilis]